MSNIILRTHLTFFFFIKVVLAYAVASAAAQIPYNTYAAGIAAPYPYAAHGIAAAPVAAYAAAPAVAAAPVADLTPRAIPHAVPAAVSHSLGLPEAAGYALPPVRQVQEAPIVEQFVEPVEQWGYKVAY